MALAPAASPASALDGRRLRRLIDVGHVLASDLDLESLLHRVLDVARELSSARYAALSLLDERGRPERFVLAGSGGESFATSDELPHSTFLEIPIEVRGRRYGRLHLSEKRGGDFDAADHEAAAILAEWAGIAIDNARLYAQAIDRQEQLGHMVARLGATAEIAQAIGGETRLDRVLDTVARRGRALVEARTMLVLAEERGVLTVGAAAGERVPPVGSGPMSVDGAAWRGVMSERRSERLTDIGGRLGISLRGLGIDADAALLVPLVFRGRSIGVLAAFDGAREFSPTDEMLLSGFAASAAIAIATAQSLAETRLRESIEVAERERGRWARELHDETLQGLGAVRVLLASSLHSADPAARERAIGRAVGQIEDEIANLRSLITELRPAALDELGLEPAIRTLAANHAASAGTEVELDFDLADSDEPGRRLEAELESTIYRVIQEALTNVAKHARAERVWIEVCCADGDVLLAVRDDGAGFDMDRRSEGFGVIGMRERVALAGGTLTIVSTPGVGTELRARIPLTRAKPGKTG